MEIYERNDGTLALTSEYGNDENTTHLLRRLRDVAERFRPLLYRNGYEPSRPLSERGAACKPDAAGRNPIAYAGRRSHHREHPRQTRRCGVA